MVLVSWKLKILLALTTNSKHGVHYKRRDGDGDDVIKVTDGQDSGTRRLEARSASPPTRLPCMSPSALFSNAPIMVRNVGRITSVIPLEEGPISTG